MTQIRSCCPHHLDIAFCSKAPSLHHTFKNKEIKTIHYPVLFYSPELFYLFTSRPTASPRSAPSWNGDRAARGQRDKATVLFCADVRVSGHCEGGVIAFYFGSRFGLAGRHLQEEVTPWASVSVQALFLPSLPPSATRQVVLIQALLPPSLPPSATCPPVGKEFRCTGC